LNLFIFSHQYKETKSEIYTSLILLYNSPISPFSLILLRFSCCFGSSFIIGLLVSYSCICIGVQSILTIVTKPYSKSRKFYQYFPIANLKFIEIYWNFDDKVWQTYFSSDFTKFFKFCSQNFSKFHQIQDLQSERIGKNCYLHEMYYNLPKPDI
jgi:hypothetical protein